MGATAMLGRKAVFYMGKIRQTPQEVLDVLKIKPNKLVTEDQWLGVFLYNSAIEDADEQLERILASFSKRHMG
jgi:hypothetical protein